MLVAAALGLSFVACAGSDGQQEHGASSHAAIVGGTPAPVAASPVVMIVGPNGFCSGIHVAVNLVVTARHCTAQFMEGVLDCTPSGELAPGSPGGGIGADDKPSDLRIYLPSSASSGAAQGTPDAVGQQILSTQSPSGCRDDLSFIVLDRPLPVVPVPVRLDRATSVGEPVSVWGYGQTMNASDPRALRVYDTAQIVAVGPSVAMALAQLAPVRSVRIGDGAITCDGDSGGPIRSKATGALIAVVSIGQRAVPGGACSGAGDSPTTGPRMAEYRDLVLRAFAAAGADPNLEPALQDAGADASAPTTVAEAGDLPDLDGSSAPGAPVVTAVGGCTASPRDGTQRVTIAALLGVALLGAVRRARSAAREGRSGQPDVGPTPSAGGAAPRLLERIGCCPHRPCGAPRHGLLHAPPLVVASDALPAQRTARKTILTTAKVVSGPQMPILDTVEVLTPLARTLQCERQN